MLSSRLEFDCLDSLDRQTHFKSPVRNMQKSSSGDSNNGTPIASRTRASRLNLSESTKRRRSPGSPSRACAPPTRIMKQSGTKYKKEWRCDRWDNDNVFCKFCNQKLEIKIRDGAPVSHSHLLYVCTGVPGLGPLAKNINHRKRPSAIHRRLSEIAAVFDPGGP